MTDQICDAGAFYYYNVVMFSTESRHRRLLSFTNRSPHVSQPGSFFECCCRFCGEVGHSEVNSCPTDVSVSNMSTWVVPSPGARRAFVPELKASDGFQVFARSLDASIHLKTCFQSESSLFVFQQSSSITSRMKLSQLAILKEEPYYSSPSVSSFINVILKYGNEFHLLYSLAPLGGTVRVRL